MFEQRFQRRGADAVRGDARSEARNYSGDRPSTSSESRVCGGTYVELLSRGSQGEEAGALDPKGVPRLRSNQIRTDKCCVKAEVEALAKRQPHGSTTLARHNLAKNLVETRGH